MSVLIIICDLEATCWENGQVQSISSMETIEIGCVLSTLCGIVVDQFSTFVKPRLQPILSEFCSSLTGINQSDVDRAPFFQDAMRNLDQWVDQRTSMWGSWGNFDYKLLTDEQGRTGVQSEFTKLNHINIKKAWRRTTKRRKQNGLNAALGFHGLEFLGRPHRAINDAINTCRLLNFIPTHEIDLQLPVNHE